MSGLNLRSFTRLERKPSNSRILNLRRTLLEFSDNPELAERPFFQNTGLNKSLIIKHHLRPHEASDFEEPRSSATKVILPIDHESLRSGAKSFLIGQRDYDALVRREFGFKSLDEPDLHTLAALDEVRSFAPFLLRGELKFRGIEPAACYFAMQSSDLAAIMSFVEAEVSPLVDAAFGASFGHSGALARKLVADVGSEELAPLGKVLQLDPIEFASVVLSWKAFIYYKYELSQMRNGLKILRTGLDTISPSKKASADDMEQISYSRASLRRALKSAVQEVSGTLNVYDAAYKSLVQKAGALQFQTFLREAPALADRLGAAVGVVEHMVSFWRYHFPTSRSDSLTAEELLSSFQQFEGGVRATINVSRPE